jgi:phosphoglycerate dehydrogenase-like enzyme
MKLLILLHHRFGLWNPPDWFAARLRRDFPPFEVVHLRDYAQAAEPLRDADVLVTWSLRPEQFAEAKKLRWIHSPAAAVHQLIVPEMIARDVVVTNARSVHGPVVAEHALAMIFALAKKIPEAMRFQAQRVWAQQQLWEDRPGPREVAGATLGLIGLGSIGAEVARLAAAVGMRIVAVREHPEKGTEHRAQPRAGASGVSWHAEAVYGPDQLERMLAVADYVVIAAPLTGRTRAIINAERLAQMKPEACLINVARGALVDEPALIAALRSRKIAGAALDVFSAEPLPPDSPLWQMEHVLITPHTAAVTDRLWTRHYELLSDNLRRFLAGEPLRGIVDKSKGY